MISNKLHTIAETLTDLSKSLRQTKIILGYKKGYF